MEVPYRTMQEIVYDTLKDGILCGKYRPGQRLIVNELAKELGVSQMPIREALHRLQVAGLVTMERHRGAMVSQLSEEEMLELYRIRAVLDGLAAQLATPHVTQKDLDRLNALTDEMAAAAKENDLQRHLRANRDFHETIWNAAQAPQLKDLLQKLYESSQRFRNFSILVPGHLEQIIQSHRRIVSALASGDAAAAEQVAKDHHQKTIHYLLTVVNPAQKQPAPENVVPA